MKIIKSILSISLTIIVSFTVMNASELEQSTKCYLERKKDNKIRKNNIKALEQEMVTDRTIEKQSSLLIEILLHLYSKNEEYSRSDKIFKTKRELALTSSVKDAINQKIDRISEKKKAVVTLRERMYWGMVTESYSEMPEDIKKEFDPFIQNSECYLPLSLQKRICRQLATDNKQEILDHLLMIYHQSLPGISGATPGETPKQSKHFVTIEKPTKQD
ncbi:MAG: hypothetical protein M1114_05185 [Candidatus Dependentiae bacterium]|nr:hypothetical protein [Candidatus Dependentiae bacterium]